jgi:hypothetical protein
MGVAAPAIDVHKLRRILQGLNCFIYTNFCSRVVKLDLSRFSASFFLFRHKSMGHIGSAMAEALTRPGNHETALSSIMSSKKSKMIFCVFFYVW